jgi:hypothetical protein
VEAEWIELSGWADSQDQRVVENFHHQAQADSAEPLPILGESAWPMIPSLFGPTERSELDKTIS